MRLRGAKRAVLAVALAFALADCGGGDETADTSGATGAQGATGATAPIELTADEFLPLFPPEKKAAVAATLRATPGCDEVSPDLSLVLLVSDEAGQADPDTPLAELVKDHC